MYCSQCGTLNESTAHFCKNCGNALSITQPTELTDTLYIPQTAPKNEFTTMLFWSALAVLIGFFLPWFSVAGIITYNGWNVSSLLLQVANWTNSIGSETTLYSIMLHLMPVSALATIIGLFTNPGSLFVKIIKFIPLLVVLVFTVIIIANIKGEITGEAFNYISVGFYITIIGALLLAVSPAKK